MIKRLRNSWEITEPWQWLWLVIGFLGLLLSGYLTARAVLGATHETDMDILVFTVISLISMVIYLFVTLWLFSKLYNRWEVSYRWELIAIFVGFAITGSLSARLSDPLLEWIGLSRDSVSGWIYWPIRIILIFPIYQFLLVGVGWLCGQFTFFWNFEKKMLRRFGIKL